MNKINFESSKSLSRPAWTQYNLNASNNKYTIRRGKPVVLIDYYIKTKGLDR